MIEHGSIAYSSFYATLLSPSCSFTCALCCLPTVLSPLARIPSPFGASLSRLWMVMHAWKGDMHRQMINLYSKYGKLVRTGPNEIAVSDLGAIKNIYGLIALSCLGPS
jgi:hypothetical protein